MVSLIWSSTMNLKWCVPGRSGTIAQKEFVWALSPTAPAGGRVSGPGAGDGDLGKQRMEEDSLEVHRLAALPVVVAGTDQDDPLAAASPDDLGVDLLWSVGGIFVVLGLESKGDGAVDDLGDEVGTEGHGIRLGWGI